MARPKKLTEAEKMRDVEAYTHDDKKRTNNPPVGMAQHDKAEEKIKTYQFDPHLDPTLQWAGKAEGTSFEVPTSSIHIHESIKPHSIISHVMKEYSGPWKGSLWGSSPCLKRKLLLSGCAAAGSLSSFTSMESTGPIG